MKRKEREEGNGEVQKFRRVAPKVNEEQTYDNPGLPMSTFDLQRQQMQQQQHLQQFQQFHNQGQYVLPHLTSFLPRGYNSRMPTQQPQTIPVKFETALEFLDQVKNQFQPQPAVYKNFLKIMKEFKSHEIDTPGVIQKVTELFQGHNHLIMGFNHFLPEGYKIEAADLQNTNNLIGAAAPQNISSDANFSSLANVSSSQSAPNLIHQHIPNSPVMLSPLPSINQPMFMSPQSQMMYPQSIPSSIPSSPPSSASIQLKKQPELEHARNYVKKIKMRFDNEPEVYRNFLRILHTYHEEHAIKDVYSQVEKLFADHQDLLVEFKQFLPDTSVSMTNNRGRTKKEKLPNFNQNQPQNITPQRDQFPNVNVLTHRQLQKRSTKRSPERKKASYLGITSPPQGGSYYANNNNNNNIPGVAGGMIGGYGDSLSPPSVQVTKPIKMTDTEIDFFFRFKKSINNQRISAEVIKLMSLYNDDILSYSELMIMIKDLLEDFPESYDLLKQFCNQIRKVEKSSKSSKNNHHNSNAALNAFANSIPMDNISSRSEINFSSCKRYGPSYIALPKKYTQRKCTGRTDLCRETLNDSWISVPTGSEESGNFKTSRKNQYEEILFKSEDDRYELDMVIETATSTLKFFTILLKRIIEWPENRLREFKVSEKLHIHYERTIERIYGHEKSKEMIVALYENPIVAIPVILRRLRQKDQEWRKSRRDWNKIWSEITQKNYFKALDHHGYYSKQKDKKLFNKKSYLWEIKHAPTSFQPKLSIQVSPFYLLFPITNTKLIPDLLELIRFQGKNSLTPVEFERQESFLTRFFAKSSFMIDFVPQSFEQFENTLLLPPDQNDKPDDQLLDEKESGGSNNNNTNNGLGNRGDSSALEIISEDGNPDLDLKKRASHRIITCLSKQSSNSTNNNDDDNNDDDNNDNKNDNNDQNMEKQAVSPSSSPNSNNNNKNNEGEEVNDAFLFYGNTAFYFLYRYFNELYYRINECMEMGLSALRDKKINNVKNVMGYFQSNYSKFDSLEAIYSYFMNHILIPFLIGDIDNAKYEDDCRELFGVESYILYALDKLLQLIVNQIQTILGNEICLKTIEFFETQREFDDDDEIEDNSNNNNNNNNIINTNTNTTPSSSLSSSPNSTTITTTTTTAVITTNNGGNNNDTQINNKKYTTTLKNVLNIHDKKSTFQINPRANKTMHYRRVTNDELGDDDIFLFLYDRSDYLLKIFMFDKKNLCVIPDDPTYPPPLVPTCSPMFTSPPNDYTVACDVAVTTEYSSKLSEVPIDTSSSSSSSSSSYPPSSTSNSSLSSEVTNSNSTPPHPSSSSPNIYTSSDIQMKDLQSSSSSSDQLQDQSQPESLSLAPILAPIQSSSSSEVKPSLLNSTPFPSIAKQTADTNIWPKVANIFHPPNPTHPELRKSKVFMIRNLRKNQANLNTIMENVINLNNLECKVIMSTYRLFYVEESEDYFYRKGKLGKAREDKFPKRSSKYKQWISDISTKYNVNNSNFSY